MDQPGAPSLQTPAGGREGIYFFPRIERMASAGLYPGNTLPSGKIRVGVELIWSFSAS